MKNYLSLIKFSHTVFALPFALIGYVLGLHDVQTGIQWKLLLLVVICMVLARSAAMAFNRYADVRFDAANARTRVREIPAGILSPQAVLNFVIICSVLFIATTYFINRLCFALSPVALAVILGYSYTKRFTAWSHFVLGLGLALAPVGAYMAVTAAFAVIPVLLGFVVLLWVSGFDIIYAMQDIGFDREHQLRSMPVRLGSVGALRASTIAHVICAVLFGVVVYMMTMYYPQLGWPVVTGAAVFVLMLIYQHRLVRPDDLSRVNLAFFTTNGIASVFFGLMCILDFYV